MPFDFLGLALLLNISKTSTFRSIRNSIGTVKEVTSFFYLVCKMNVYVLSKEYVENKN